MGVVKAVMKAIPIIDKAIKSGTATLEKATRLMDAQERVSKIASVYREASKVPTDTYRSMTKLSSKEIHRLQDSLRKRENSLVKHGMAGSESHVFIQQLRKDLSAKSRKQNPMMFDAAVKSAEAIRKMGKFDYKGYAELHKKNSALAQAKGIRTMSQLKEHELQTYDRVVIRKAHKANDSEFFHMADERGLDTRKQFTSRELRNLEKFLDSLGVSDEDRFTIENSGGTIQELQDEFDREIYYLFEDTGNAENDEKLSKYRESTVRRAREYLHSRGVKV